MNITIENLMKMTYTQDHEYFESKLNQNIISIQQNGVINTVTRHEKNDKLYKISFSNYADLSSIDMRMNCLLSPTMLKNLEKDLLKIHIVQHTDLDGDASAAFFWNALKTCYDVKHSSVSIYRYNYDKDEFQHILEEISKEQQKNPDMYHLVAVFDLNLPLSSQQALYHLSSGMIYFDHHTNALHSVEPGAEPPIMSFIEELKNDTSKDSLVYVDTTCCTTFTMAKILSHCLSKSESYMILPSLVSIYDTKADKKYPKVYEISTYLNTYYYNGVSMRSDMDIWTHLIQDSEQLLLILNAGQEFDKINQQLMNLKFQNSYLFYFMADDQHSTICVGLYAQPNPLISARLDELIRLSSKYKHVVKFFMHERNGKVVVSIFTDDQDVQDFNLGLWVNKHFGGGGHRGACGFNQSSHQFELAAYKADSESKKEHLIKHFGIVVFIDKRIEIMFKHLFTSLLSELSDYYDSKGEDTNV